MIGLHLLLWLTSLFFPVPQGPIFGGTSGGGGGSFTLLHQTADNCSCSSQTTTIPSTTANSTLFIQAWESSGSTNFISTGTPPTDGGDTFTVPTGNSNSVCQQANAIDAALSCAYVLVGAGGKTSVVMTFSASSTYVWVIWEVADTAGHTPTLDVQGSNTNTATTTPSGVNLSLTASDVVFQQVGTPSGALSACASPYANFAGTTGRGFCAAYNISSVMATNMWTNGASATSIVSAVAIKAN